MHKKRVGIVGAGPAGLMAIRHALLNGFEPVAFEKNLGVGGVWNSQTGAVWESMTTNLSKYTCCFRDHPWPQDTTLFPPSREMTSYIDSYAQKFCLFKYIKFDCSVVSLSQNTNGYQIEWSCSGKVEKQFFQFVIVASGIFVHPNMPLFKGIQSFPGKISHSKSYKKGSDHEGKKVLVIGGSFTGIQLAGDLSRYSQAVTHSFHSHFWVLPHFLPIGPKSNGKTPKLPIDFFYNRKFYEHADNSSNVQDARISKNKFYSSICHQQQQNPSLSIPEQKWGQPMYVTISSQYMHQVKKGHITPKRSDVAKIEESTVTFQDGSSQVFDQIIMCTGYKSSLNFLSPQIKQIIEFDQHDRLQPVILYQQAYHPKLPNIFFIGIYKGPYFAVLELQVIWAFNNFMGKSNESNEEQMQKGLQSEREIRYRQPRPQFPHNQYIKFADQIANIASRDFPLKEFLRDKEVSQELKDKFLKMNVFPCFPQSFTLHNIEEQIQISRKLTEQTVVNNID